MNKQTILEKINTARKLCYITNLYSYDTLDYADKFWELNDSFVFSYTDHGILRLIYYVRDYETLDRLLSKIEAGKYYLEIITKDINIYKPSNMSLVAKLMRMSTTDCGNVFKDSKVLQYRNDEIVEKASLEDAQEINKLLWKTFHTEISHLLTDEELSERIELGQIFIHKSQSIDALLQVEVRPKKFYINQIVNLTDKKVIHAILLKNLWEYFQNGGNYVYAWVEEKNIASIKFHEKYGMRHDGMWNLVFCLDKS